MLLALRTVRDFDKAEKNAAEYIAKLLTERKWDISHVKKHQDFDGKYCPHRTLDKGWQRFLNMVKRYMEPAKTPVASKFTPYLIRKNCRDPLNIRKGPGTNYGMSGPDQRTRCATQSLKSAAAPAPPRAGAVSKPAAGLRRTG